MKYQSDSPSGFSILVHSLPLRILSNLWNCLNNLIRVLLPAICLLMMVVVGIILCAVVFANQHLPCWYDEIYMLDPIYHRVTTGVWHSIAQWDSFDTIPFAPNYPLLCIILRVLIDSVGVKCFLIRGMMLLLGLFPVVGFLWLSWKKGIYQNRFELVQGLYFSACSTFFIWAVSVRPEGVLLSVCFLLAWAWMQKRMAFLFLLSLLVPLCGLQWNILLVPALLHWTVFGGSFRRPFLMAVAFALSSIVSIAAYHVLGMWPSFLQEAARVGGFGALQSAREHLSRSFTAYDFQWLLNPKHLPPLFLAFIILVFGVSASSCFLCKDSRSLRKILVFIFLCFSGILVAFSLHHMLEWYIAPLLFFPILLSPLLLRTCFSKYPAILLLFAVFALKLAVHNWDKIRNIYPPHMDFRLDSCWLDESSLEDMLKKSLSSCDVVAAPDSAWFAVCSCCRDYVPLAYVFDISESQQRAISAVLIPDEPSRPRFKDGSNGRQAYGYASVMLARFCPPDASCSHPDEISVSPDELLDTIANHWHCSFTEVTMPNDSMPHAIRYRLFKPTFADEKGTTCSHGA